MSQWGMYGEQLLRIGWKDALTAVTEQGYTLWGNKVCLEREVVYYLTERSLELLNRALADKQFGKGE